MLQGNRHSSGISAEAYLVNSVVAKKVYPFMITEVAVLILPCRIWVRLILIGFLCGSWHGQCLAQAAPDEPKSPQRWAVILVGLPGDSEHEAQFGESADMIQTWLTETLEFPRDHVSRLPASANDGGEPLSAERVSSALAELKPKLLVDDTLWVFLLGHGNYDGKRAWFHLAGKDPSSADVGRWLEDVRCREQVIWLTQSSSGWFLKPLSKTGRIVIAATATDDESNETEFPHAFAAVSKWPISKLDRDGNNVVTVAELYTAVVGEVLRRFQSDNRLPTEHAQIDDNGDGIGTEDIQKMPSDDPIPPQQRSTAKADGELAKKTVVPFQKLNPTGQP